MNVLAMNIFLALVWSALVGGFSLNNLITGFVLGYLTLFLIRRALGPTNYFYKGGQLLGFIIYFLWELFIANLRVARDVLWPGPLRVKPRVIAVPLDRCSDLGITLLANILSLTPGSLSLDVSKDPCVLFVHSMHAPDAEAARRQIKSGFEQQVLSLLRGRQRVEREAEPGALSLPALDEKEREK